MTVQNTQWQTYHEHQPLPTPGDELQRRLWFKRPQRLGQRWPNNQMWC